MSILLFSDLILLAPRYVRMPAAPTRTELVPSETSTELIEIWE